MQHLVNLLAFLVALVYIILRVISHNDISLFEVGLVVLCLLGLVYCGRRLLHSSTPPIKR